MNRGQRRAQWRARRAESNSGLLPVGSSDGSSHRATQAVAPAVAPPEVVAAPATINLRFGELALHGFDAGHGRRIADALQYSLTAMLISQGVPDAWSKSSRAGRVNGGTLRLTTGASPKAIGEELARRLLTVRTDERS